MASLLRHDAFGVSQILDNKPVFFNAQDGELVAFRECDDVSGFPVADGELMDTQTGAVFGDEFVAVQHSGIVTL